MNTQSQDAIRPKSAQNFYCGISDRDTIEMVLCGLETLASLAVSEDFPKSEGFGMFLIVRNLQSALRTLQRDDDQVGGDA